MKTIPLTGSPSVAQAATLHTTVQDAFADEGAVAFDLSELRSLDASILQLLLAAQTAAKASGGHVQLVDVSESLAQLLESCGALQLRDLITTPDSDSSTGTEDMSEAGQPADAQSPK